MAGVEGMSFLGGGIHLAGDKESGSFYGHDLDEAGSTDFFDQFVLLDGSDTEATGGEGLGLGHFGVSELSISPHPPSTSSIDASLQVPHTSSGDPGGAAVAGSNNLGGRSPVAIGSNGVLPSNVGSGQLQQPLHQQLHQLRRTTSSMAAFNFKSEIDMEGLQYDNSTFADSFGGSKGGTVSDSELLKLEGLDLRSRRVEAAPQPASLPASPPLMAVNPSKISRIGAFCSKFRNKTFGLQGRSKQQQQQHNGRNGIIKQEPTIQPSSLMSTAQMGPSKSSSSPSSSSSSSSSSSHSRPKPNHLNLTKVQMPLSPPLTGAGPMTAPLPVSLNGADAGFITTGNPFLDDPFLQDHMMFRGQFSIPASSSSTNLLPLAPPPSLPPQTPLDGSLVVPDWPITTIPDSPSSVFPDPSSAWAVGWDPDIPMDTDISLSLSFHQQATAQAAAQAQAQAQAQAHRHHQQQLFEYPPPPSSPSIIHSPLMSMSMSMPMSIIPPPVPHNYPPPHSHHQQQQQQQSRRPKPRAPSSGARHHHSHHHHSQSLSSPRKTRSSQHLGSSSSSGAASSSNDYSSSSSPIKSTHHRRRSSSNSDQHHPSSSPNVLRKRQSWSNNNNNTTTAYSPQKQQQKQPTRRASSQSLYGTSNNTNSIINKKSSYYKRTASCSSLNSRLISSCSSSSLSSSSAAAIAAAAAAAEGGRRRKKGHSGGGGGGVTIDGNSGAVEGSSSNSGGGGFVNYTPQDRTLLMTGVAPSGSSKTKARREKEAIERDREYKERLAKAVRAAGGDLSKLQEEIIAEGSGGGGGGGGEDTGGVLAAVDGGGNGE